MGVMIDTVGLEIETDGTRREQIPTSVQRYWGIDHDASIESDVRIADNGWIVDDDIRLPIPTTKAVSGVEFVSPVINTRETDLFNQIVALTSFLNRNGEPAESKRAGIHVHVALPYNLESLHRTVRLIQHLETVIFYISGMGYTFRGESNNFAYCRPFTQYGPPIVLDTNNQNIQIYHTDDLLESTSTGDFWNRYGGLNEQRKVNKYHAARYSIVTLFNMCQTKGTIEFRGFNKTLNPFYIKAAVDFSQAFCKAIFIPDSLLNLEDHSIYNQEDREDILRTFFRFAGVTGMESSTIDILARIIDQTPEIHIEPEYTYSHLCFHPQRQGDRYGFASGYSPRVIKDPVARPNYVDIHVLRGN